MSEPQYPVPDDSRLLHSSDVCRDLGITGVRLREIAEREGIEYLMGYWGVDEVKRIARRLLVIGSPTEKAHARSVIRDLVSEQAS